MVSHETARRSNLSKFSTSQCELGCKNQGNPTPGDVSRRAPNKVHPFQMNKFRKQRNIAIITIFAVQLFVLTMATENKTLSDSERMAKRLHGMQQNTQPQHSSQKNQAGGTEGMVPKWFQNSYVRILKNDGIHDILDIEFERNDTEESLVKQFIHWWATNENIAPIMQSFEKKVIAIKDMKIRSEEFGTEYQRYTVWFGHYRNKDEQSQKDQEGDTAGEMVPTWFQESYTRLILDDSHTGKILNNKFERNDKNESLVKQFIYFWACCKKDIARQITRNLSRARKTFKRSEHCGTEYQRYKIWLEHYK